MAAPTEAGQIRPGTTSNPNQDIAFKLMRITCDDIGQQSRALDFLLASIATIAGDIDESEGVLFEGLYYNLSNINNEIKDKVSLAGAIYKEGWRQ